MIVTYNTVHCIPGYHHSLHNHRKLFILFAGNYVCEITQLNSSTSNNFFTETLSRDASWLDTVILARTPPSCVSQPIIVSAGFTSPFLIIASNYVIRNIYYIFYLG